jgi:hypothetical protein
MTLTQLFTSFCSQMVILLTGVGIYAYILFRVPMHLSVMSPNSFRDNFGKFSKILLRNSLLATTINQIEAFCEIDLLAGNTKTTQRSTDPGGSGGASVKSTCWRGTRKQHNTALIRAAVGVLPSLPQSSFRQPPPPQPPLIKWVIN